MGQNQIWKLTVFFHVLESENLKMSQTVKRGARLFNRNLKAQQKMNAFCKESYPEAMHVYDNVALIGWVLFGRKWRDFWIFFLSKIKRKILRF